MAAIIDGSTYNGYYKITPTDNDLNAYYVVPKSSFFFSAVDATTGAIKSGESADINVSTDANTIDENDNALDTPAKVDLYISQNR